MKKATGIVRKVDELGRIVIPKELRRTMGIDISDSLEVYVSEDEVILKKYQPDCVFCGSMDDLQSHEGKMVCRKCVLGMSSKFAGSAPAPAPAREKSGERKG